MTRYITEKNFYPRSGLVSVGTEFTKNEWFGWGLDEAGLDTFLQKGIVKEVKEHVEPKPQSKLEPKKKGKGKKKSTLDSVHDKGSDSVPDDASLQDLTLEELNAKIIDVSTSLGIEPSIFDNKEDAIKHLSGE